MAQIIYYVSANFSDYEGYWETFLGVFDTLADAEKVKLEYEKVVENIKSEENPVPDEMINLSVIEWPDGIYDKWDIWNSKQWKLYDYNGVQIRNLVLNEKQNFEL